MPQGVKDVPGASGEADFFELPTSSNLLLTEGKQILVPGRKRLMREAHDSDSDEEKEEATVFLISKKAGVLVPGRKRLLERVQDSDSDEDEEHAPGSSSSEKRLRLSVCSEAVSLSQAEIGVRRLKEAPDKGGSDCSEDDVLYLRTERAELSQSLLTSWLVLKRSRTGV